MGVEIDHARHQGMVRQFEMRSVGVLLANDPARLDGDDLAALHHQGVLFEDKTMGLNGDEPARVQAACCSHGRARIGNMRILTGPPREKTGWIQRQYQITLQWQRFAFYLAGKQFGH
ncbi:hypothetical protein GCM10027296_44660 [Chitinimonas naiadis]